jgi:hypothetical protein
VVDVLVALVFVQLSEVSVVVLVPVTDVKLLVAEVLVDDMDNVLVFVQLVALTV